MLIWVTLAIVGVVLVLGVILYAALNASSLADDEIEKW